MMLSIRPCTYWQLVDILRRNVYSNSCLLITRIFPFFFFFLAPPVACGHSWGQVPNAATAATQDASVTTQDP